MKPVTNIIKPRIYVACLTSYNSGGLHGAWIDAAQDAWTIHDGVAAMLKASTVADAEEWAIHDYEGFMGLRVGEHDNIHHVAEVAAFLVEHGRLGAELVIHHGDIAEARQAMEEQYVGVYASLADFAEELTEETTSIPRALRCYINWDAMARDMAINDVVALQTGPDQVHVFWNR